MEDAVPGPYPVPYPGASPSPAFGYLSDCIFRSLERGRPGLFTSRHLSLGPRFVPTSPPTLGGSAGGSAAGVGLAGGSGGRPVPPRQPASRAEAQAQRLADTGKAAGSSGLPKRLWRGHHRLIGTERCLWKPNLVLGSDWGVIFFFSPETLLLSLPIYGSCLPRPLPLPNSTRLTPRLLPRGSNWNLKLRVGAGTLGGSLLLSGRKDSLAFLRPLSTPSSPATGNG